MVQSDTLVQVSIIDEHGTLISNTAEQNPKHIDLSDREHFKVHEHENDDNLYISKPVLGRVSGQWTLQMTRRLNHPDGSFAGVVVVSEDPSYFTSDFYNNAAIGRDGVIAVISDNGTVLARRTGNAEANNGKFSASGSYPTSEHVSGTYVDSIDNVTRIFSYRHIDGYPLGVLVGLSQAEEFADYNHTRNVYLLMAGFISLAMLSFFAVATGLIGKLLGPRARDDASGRVRSADRPAQPLLDIAEPAARRRATRRTWAGSRSSLSISTTSRPSTTRSATTPATSCCK